MTRRAQARATIALLAALGSCVCIPEASSGRNYLLSSFPPPIGPSCPQFPALNGAGVLCENFDSERNGVPGFQFTRLPIGADPDDPLRAIGDPNDDLLGYTQTAVASPIGTAGRICSNLRGLGRLGCDGPVAEENDWHLHSSLEGPGSGYDDGWFGGARPGIGAPDGGKAHSGVRSMHWGRHVTFDDPDHGGGTTNRYRQIAAFAFDPSVNLGPASTLQFWHLISVLNDENAGLGFLPPGKTFGGGQVQISMLGDNGKFDKWRRLTPGFNGYDASINETISICQFDPGDDARPPNDDTMCTSSPMWAHQGDVIGTDATCATDTDGNDPMHKDCGRISSCTGGPGCTENGSIGTGVWTRSSFDLSPFAGRQARVRWIGSMGGGWSFGITRSALESSGPLYQYDQGDDGWWLDDIVLTDLRQAPLPCGADADGDGFIGCAADCNDNDGAIYPGAPDLCDGVLNDCNHPEWPFQATSDDVDNDGDGLAECQGDCNDGSPAAHPGATEICDSLDNDCDGSTDEGFDQDGDGVRACTGDCDDTRATVYSGAPQICDGLNNNCLSPSWPGLAGTNESDGDGDGFTGCQGDCNDGIATAHPGAAEICDLVDNDCDNQADEGFDLDGDTYQTCRGDCDDANPSVYPNAPQVCDGLNNSCTSISWPGLAGTNEDDRDGDGFTGCTGDCNDTLSYAWGTPGEVRDLTLSGDTQATLSWVEPLMTGGSDFYDVFRTLSSNSWSAGVVCLVNHSLFAESSDNASPEGGSAFYYLVRAETACPAGQDKGPLGFTSSGVPHPGTACP